MSIVLMADDKIFFFFFKKKTLNCAIDKYICDDDCKQDREIFPERMNERLNGTSFFYSLFRNNQTMMMMIKLMDSNDDDDDGIFSMQARQRTLTVYFSLVAILTCYVLYVCWCVLS